VGIFFLTTASRTVLGPTQPPLQWVLGALTLGVKRPGREADHSPPSSAEVEECLELYLHFPNTPLWRVSQLKKPRDNFIIIIIIIIIVVVVVAGGWLVLLLRVREVLNKGFCGVSLLSRQIFG
jgi:hypothetical protein